MDGLVQPLGEARVDAVTIDNQSDLDASVPSDLCDIWIRIRAGRSPKSCDIGLVAICDQFGSESLVHADLCRSAKRPVGRSGYNRGVDNHHLVHCSDLAILSLGGSRPTSLFAVGLHRHDTAAINCYDELDDDVIRFGLCCSFRDEPIKFATTTAAAIGRMTRPLALAKLSDLCLANADALLEALRFCVKHQIGCFRVNSQILPVKTHPAVGYDISDLPDSNAIVDRFRESKTFAAQHQLRTCFHPDQFVVLNSQRPEVVEASIRELEYQAEVAEWIGADVINIHGGGAFGDKAKATSDFAKSLDRLSPRVRDRLTVENDDKIFAPADLLPVCREAGIPLVYDVHHHRCHRDDLSEAEATDRAIATWNREPLFHISSPLEGWSGPKPARHHDFIDIKDFPDDWRDQQITIEVEAKAKEIAVIKLKNDLKKTIARNSR